jgi:hypothetical protein
VRSAVPFGAVLVLGLALVGCTASRAASTETPSATPVVSVVPSGAPSSAGTPSAAPAPSAGPTVDPAGGCPANHVRVPAGATTASVGDLDGDQRSDTAFYSEAGPFEYGIRTASGATIVLRDDLAGPGAHSGWSAKLDGPAIVATVLDDGRTATLHAFVNCAFVTTKGPDGSPYRFALNGFGTAGTGVACNDRNGGTLIEGALAVKRSGGRYDIRWTLVRLSADGTKATNGETETRYSGLAASDARVKQAMGSRCGSAPKVGTSGR